MASLLLVPIDNLWCDVVGRATDGLALLLRTGQLGRQAKVSNLDGEVLVKEQVAKLQVAVDDVNTVHVADSIEQLLHVVLDFGFGEALPPLDHLVHGLVLAQLEEDVAVNLVLEEVLVLANITMLETAVDFDFCLKLWFVCMCER